MYLGGGKSFLKLPATKRTPEALKFVIKYYRRVVTKYCRMLTVKQYTRLLKVGSDL